MTLLNIFHSGGLWALPLLLLLAAVWSFARAVKASKSGSIVGGSTENPLIKDGGGNVPVYQTAQFKFAIIFLIAAVAVFIIISNDYKGV